MSRPPGVLAATHIGSSHSPAQLLHARAVASRQPIASSSKTTLTHDLFNAVDATRFQRNTYTGPDGLEEEIGWWGRTVVWSRGPEIHRTFSFEEDAGSRDDRVTWAGFVWFPAHGDSTDRDLGAETTTEVEPPTQKRSTGKEGLFGPFHQSQDAIWGQAPATTSGAQHPRLVRTLLICRREQATVFYPSGDDFKLHLPFLVDAAFALSPDTGGVMLQRALTRAERRKIDGETTPPLDPRSKSLMDAMTDQAGSEPRVYALMNPFHEIKRVIEAQVQEETIVDEGAPLGWTDAILFSADDPYPFVIALDRQENELVFYVRRRVPMVDAAPAPTKMYQRPHELMEELSPVSPTEPLHPRPTMHRAASGFIKDRRLSAMQTETNDRTRSGPRVSRGGMIEPQLATHERTTRSSNTTADLQAALDPLPLAATNASKPTGSRLSTRGRTSILGQAVPPEPPNGGISHTTQEDLRRTTMLMGLERESTARSEMVLERMWTWRIPAGSDFTSAGVFLSENISATSVQINIHNASTLHRFQATKRGDWRIQPLTAFACDAAVPVLAARHRIFDTLILHRHRLLLLTSNDKTLPLSLPDSLLDHKDELPRHLASTLSMGLDADSPMGDAHARRVRSIVHSFDSTASIQFDGGETARISVDYRIRDNLVHQCLEAIAWSLSPDAVFAIKRELLLSRRADSQMHDQEDAWDAFVYALKSALGVGVVDRQSVAAAVDDPILRKLATRVKDKRKDPQASNTPRQTARSPEFDRASLAKILYSLHIVAQDYRLAQSLSRDLEKVASLVIDLCHAAGQLDWLDYWSRLMPGYNADPAPATLSDWDMSPLVDAAQPPDIIAYLSRRLLTPLEPFPVPADSVDDAQPQPACHAIQTIIAIYDRLAIAADQPNDPRGRAESIIRRGGAVIAYMIAHNLDHAYINDLPVGVAMPILEVMRACQAGPDKGWTPEMYDFVGRSDLAAQARGISIPSRDRDDMPDDTIPTVGDIMASVEKDYAKHAHILPTMPQVRFGSDKRLEEVERIMQTTRVRTIETKAPAGMSDADLPNWQQGEVNTIANRTLSILVGKGMFEYGTRPASVTQASDIPLIELAVKVVPGNATLQAHIANESADWPCFHNGVAAGLAISPGSKGVDSSWIVFNRPATLNQEHGGFLLGLGLSGHLRSLTTYHAFSYMEPKHEYTSIGLLLGLAASFAGSEDILVTKVLSLHTHALLPPGSMELGSSALTQSTALVGVGLVHAGTKNMRMAEMALGEIGRIDIPGVDGFKDYAEAYSFSASMAFGLIMLGRGGQTDSVADNRIVKGLTKRIIGEAPSLHAKAAVEMDTNVTAPGATLALGLMYLKANRQDIAGILAVPSSPQELESIRPDILLVRTLARALIMWNDVYPSIDWVERQLPTFIHYKDHKNTGEMEQQTELAYLNIIAGACLAIGIKCAGTAGETAHNTLTMFANVLSKASAGPNTYEGNIRRVAARQGLGIVTIALTVVMSGTGELNALRRIRISHGQEGLGVNYGTHMAMHMALGILFLGKGYYTLGSSNLAIAAMVIAFFPRFLPSPGDNRAYPQAFRHLWALAVEPRCLIARDVDTRETIYLPVKVTLREGGQDRVQSLISPTLIAPFETLRTIEVDSPRYWPITYDLSNPRDKRALINTRTIHVKRKSAYLDYNSDPKGNRSIYIRAGSMTGLDLHYDLISPAAPPSVTPDELVELVRSHSGDPGLVALAERMTGVTRFENAVQIVLLECVTLDKAVMVPIYMSLLLALKTGVQRDRIGVLAQVAMIKRFYDGTMERDYAMPARERQVPLLRTSFIGSLWRLLTAEEPAEAEREAYWRDNVWPISAKARQALAVYLLKNAVPARECLDLLRGKVRESGGVADELSKLRTRDAAQAYSEYVEKRWDIARSDGGVTPAERALWKLQSLEEAVGAWLT